MKKNESDSTISGIILYFKRITGANQDILPNPEFFIKK